jgi:hypothetical protein
MLPAIRQAIRSVGRWRSGATIAVLTLAIGIGTATSLYAFLHAVLSRAPQIEDLATVGRIYAVSPTLGVERTSLSLNDFQMVTTASSFESVGAYIVDDSVLTLGAQTRKVSAGHASAGFFDVLRTRPAAGRLPSSLDFRDGAAVVVVSDRIWRTYFAGRAQRPTLKSSVFGSWALAIARLRLSPLSATSFGEVSP